MSRLIASSHTAKNGSQPDPFNTLRPTIYRLSNWQRLLFWPVALGIHAWCRTWRMRLDDDSRQLLDRTGSPRLILVWHNRSFLSPEVFRRAFHPERIHCLISPSRAAAWEVALFDTFRLRSVRGSSSRRGVQAMRELVRALRNGMDVGISPDGPSGPACVVQPGAVRLARMAKAPLILCQSQCRQAVRLGTWDRHLIPLPFARLDITIEVIETDDPIWQQTDEAAAKHLADRLLD